jgi:hypothetical protein
MYVVVHWWTIWWWRWPMMWWDCVDALRMSVVWAWFSLFCGNLGLSKNFSKFYPEQKLLVWTPFRLRPSDPPYDSSPPPKLCLPKYNTVNRFCLISILRARLTKLHPLPPPKKPRMRSRAWSDERVGMSLHKNPDSSNAPRYTIIIPQLGDGMPCGQNDGQIEKQQCNTDIVCPGGCAREFDWIHVFNV